MLTPYQLGHVFHDAPLSKQRCHDFGEKAVEMTMLSASGRIIVRGFHVCQQPLTKICLSVLHDPVTYEYK